VEKEVVKKIEELLALMDDPDRVVLIKEAREKLAKILEYAKNPDKITTEKQEYKNKMEKIISLVENAIIDIEINVDYCIDAAGIATGNCDKSSDAYILLTYTEDEYTTRTRKVSLGKTALQSTPEDLTKHIVLAIEEFKDEIDNIKMG